MKLVRNHTDRELSIRVVREDEGLTAYVAFPKEIERETRLPLPDKAGTDLERAKVAIKEIRDGIRLGRRMMHLVEVEE